MSSYFNSRKDGQLLSDNVFLVSSIFDSFPPSCSTRFVLKRSRRGAYMHSVYVCGRIRIDLRPVITRNSGGSRASLCRSIKKKRAEAAAADGSASGNDSLCASRGPRRWTEFKSNHDCHLTELRHRYKGGTRKMAKCTTLYITLAVYGAGGVSLSQSLHPPLLSDVSIGFPRPRVYWARFRVF